MNLTCLRKLKKCKIPKAPPRVYTLRKQFLEDRRFFSGATCTLGSEQHGCSVCELSQVPLVHLVDEAAFESSTLP